MWRKIACRKARDWNVKLGDNVILVEGKFHNRGGSAKYPQVLGSGQTVILEVRDVPLLLALREAESNNDVALLSEPKALPITISLGPDSILTTLREKHNELTDAEIVETALKFYANEN